MQQLFSIVIGDFQINSSIFTPRKLFPDFCQSFDYVLHIFGDFLTWIFYNLPNWFQLFALAFKHCLSSTWRLLIDITFELFFDGPTINTVQCLPVTDEL